MIESIILAYIAMGISMILANEAKNTFAGNIVIIIAWPIILTAMLIKKVFK